jgi:hypothetical protein
MCDLPPEAYEDCFHPPSVPTQVFCLHCQEMYDSYLIEWREEKTPRGRQGFWRCPTPGCDGAGFGFDIHPIDPDYIDPDGRDMSVCFDDEDEEEWDEDDGAATDELGELIDEIAADDFGLEPCLTGPADDEDPFAIPMDDLLPVNEKVGSSELTPGEMDEIERKIGWRPDGRSSQSSQSSPSRDDRDWSDDEDIPF